MTGKRKKHKSWIACILLLVTLISSVSMFSFESQAAGSTFDDASEEMDKIITITFMNKNKKTIAEGTFDVSDTEGLAGVFNTKTKIGDEDDLIYYCARYMYNPATISLDKEFGMSEINSSDKGEAVYCKWTVANQTYLMSTLKRYSGQKKDGVLFCRQVYHKILKRQIMVRIHIKKICLKTLITIISRHLKELR